MIIDVESSEQLNQLLRENEVVVVDFAAPSWCVPCVRFAPHYEKASEKHEAVFVHVDIDKNEWAVSEFGVQSVPTVMLFKNAKYDRHLKARTAPLLLKELE